MTTQDLIQQAFRSIDTFKRHRSLKELEGYEKRDFHEVRMYRMIDQLELSLRAISKDLRESATAEKEDNNGNS